MRNRARRNAAYKLKLQIKFDPLEMTPHKVGDIVMIADRKTGKTKKLQSTKWVSLGKIEEVLASGASYNVKFLNPGPRKKNKVGTFAKLSRRDLQRPPVHVNIDDLLSHTDNTTKEHWEIRHHIQTKRLFECATSRQDLMQCTTAGKPQRSTPRCSLPSSARSEGECAQS
ncbi:hypothetical protein DFS34DRAFT_277264 [Phlyctochytrium arcticum]|nr:hypothetical protein DFS34DRAFT_277264 [Phlyctochytrium arcticum]